MNKTVCPVCFFLSSFTCSCVNVIQPRSLQKINTNIFQLKKLNPLLFDQNCSRYSYRNLEIQEEKAYWIFYCRLLLRPYCSLLYSLQCFSPWSFVTAQSLGTSATTSRRYFHSLPKPEYLKQTNKQSFLTFRLYFPFYSHPPPPLHVSPLNHGNSCHQTCCIQFYCLLFLLRGDTN